MEMIRTDQKIVPEKVTKPIQLLAAWLIGLIVVDGIFLTAASLMEANSWERAALVIASIVNVPLFLASMFLLQTKFRPELQEDLFYSQYLDKKTNKIVTVATEEKIELELINIKSQMATLVKSLETTNNTQQLVQNPEPDIIGITWKIGVNDFLDNYEEIRAALKKEGIKIREIFGSPISKEKPSYKTVSFSKRVAFSAKSKIILLASKLGFEGYGYLDEWEEDLPGALDILIGSYGDPVFPITKELITMLNSSPDSADLVYFENKIIKDKSF